MALGLLAAAGDVMVGWEQNPPKNVVAAGSRRPSRAASPHHPLWASGLLYRYRTPNQQRSGFQALTEHPGDRLTPKTQTAQGVKLGGESTACLRHVNGSWDFNPNC